MKHPIIASVARMIRDGDAREAETALVAVADKEGDLVLAQVIAAMPPRDLVAILREHDSSRSSVVGELITPERFVAAVAMEAKYNDPTHDALRGMINMVIFREDDPDSFIEALGRSEAGLLALVDYFSDRHEELESFFQHGTFSHLDEAPAEVPEDDRDLADAEMGSSFRQPKDNLDEVQDRDWRELAWRLRCEHYETFAELLRIMRARARRAAASVTPPAVAAKSSDSDANPDDKEESFI